MKILSLFDGIACARVALDRAGIPVEEYSSIEFDKYARTVASHNYPGIYRPCNDVRDFMGGTGYDLIIGGSPCQDLSIAKKDRKGLDGERSGLFFEYVRILKACKPKYFILENVASMHKDAKAQITEILTEIYPETECHMINAALVSAQNRKRLFWTNIKGITQPEDKGIYLKDILEENVDEKYFFSMKNKINTNQGNRVYPVDNKAVTLKALGGGGAKTWLYMIQRARWNNPGWATALNWKCPTLTTGKFEHNNAVVIPINRSGEEKTKSNTVRSSGRGSGIGDKHNWDTIEVVPVALHNRWEGKKPEYNGTGKANALTTVQTDSMVEEQSNIRKLTPVECERLQCLPDNYTAGGANISNSQRYKMLGNAFNVDVIAHILTFIKNNPMQHTETPRLFSARACILPNWKDVEVVAIDFHQQKIAYTLDNMDGDLIAHWVKMDQVVWLKMANGGRPKV